MMVYTGEKSYLIQSIDFVDGEPLVFNIKGRTFSFPHITAVRLVDSYLYVPGVYSDNKLVAGTNDGTYYYVSDGNFVRYDIHYQTERGVELRKQNSKTINVILRPIRFGPVTRSRHLSQLDLETLLPYCVPGYYLDWCGHFMKVEV